MDIRKVTLAGIFSQELLSMNCLLGILSEEQVTI
jgi:hypothetical protein